MSAMKLNTAQLEHLMSLRVSAATHLYDPKTRREWKWVPHVAGPLIRSPVLFALEKRKLARWMPNADGYYHGGRMIITPAGKSFLSAVLPTT